ncbi:MAG: transporter associated domain-containing protein [Pseudomonadota bacterium]
MTAPKSKRLSRLEHLTSVLMGHVPRDIYELKQSIRDAAHLQVITSDTLSMVEGLLGLSQLRTEDVMVPRAQMNVIDLDLPFAAIIELVVNSPHSRFPIISETRDNVLGVLLAKDLLTWVRPGMNHSDFQLKDLIRPALFVPENKRLDVMLHEFRKNRKHMAIVVDEYGTVSGLLTLEDILEQVVGDIADEFDIEPDEPIKALGDNTFTLRGITTLDSFNRYFGAQLSDPNADTVAGYLMNAFGRVPEATEEVELSGFRFTILRADNRRIYLIRVIRL